ncbi:MAG: site-2 protease family protein [Gaiellaceae bacterium]
MTPSDTYRKWQGPSEEESAPELGPPSYLPGEFAPPFEPVAPDQEEAHRGLLRKLAAPFIALGALLLKFKAALLVVFKLKLFTTAGSMVVSVGAYAMIWGWRFGLGFVLLLLVHESGHALEARRQGLPVSAPVFIPFMGAAILLKEMPPNAWREARLALAGPLVGSLGALVCWGFASAYDSPLLLALAYVGFFLNLFNLLPIVPLDGGRVVAALHPAIWVVGIAVLTGLVILAPNPILLIVLLLAGYELYQRWESRHEAREREYYKVTSWQRLGIAIGYFGLAILLTLAMTHTHVVRHF